MTRQELATLVSQLDSLSQTLTGRYKDINRACVDGYDREGPQTPNMGIHMTHKGYVRGMSRAAWKVDGGSERSLSLPRS
jgi:hypothetical protein